MTKAFSHSNYLNVFPKLHLNRLGITYIITLGSKIHKTLQGNKCLIKLKIKALIHATWFESTQLLILNDDQTYYESPTYTLGWVVGAIVVKVCAVDTTHNASKSVWPALSAVCNVPSRWSIPVQSRQRLCPEEGPDAFVNTPHFVRLSDKIAAPFCLVLYSVGTLVGRENHVPSSERKSKQARTRDKTHT